MNATTSIAEKINGLLADGKTVTTTNHMRSVRYGKRNAGDFTMGKDGNLYVRSGKGKAALTMCEGSMLLCKITHT